MKSFYFLVEGQTEQRFVSDILQPHLGACCYCIPVIIKTRRDVSGQAYKGGYAPYSQWRNQIRNLLGNSSAHIVTTIVDYYGIADDFPGKQAAQSLQSPLQQVQFIEQAWAQDIDDARFIPYLSLHELESLLFADVTTLEQRLQVIQSSPQGIQLPSIVQDNPEDIDCENPPSQIISKVCPKYQKVLHTNLIIQTIGLATIRAKCPHFNDWLTNLETFCAAL